SLRDCRSMQPRQRRWICQCCAARRPLRSANHFVQRAAEGKSLPRTNFFCVSEPPCAIRAKIDAHRYAKGAARPLIVEEAPATLAPGAENAHATGCRSFKNE